MAEFNNLFFKFGKNILKNDLLLFLKNSILYRQ